MPLQSATTYTFKAYGQLNCDLNNPPVIATTTALTKPAQVSGVVVEARDKSLGVTWAAPSGTITGYKVQWKSANIPTEANYDSSRQNIVLGSATTSSIITGLLNGQPGARLTYTVRVIAYNDTGDSAASTEVTGVPKPSNPPLAPAKPTATAGDARVVLTWSPPSVTSWK